MIAAPVKGQQPVIGWVAACAMINPPQDLSQYRTNRAPFRNPYAGQKIRPHLSLHCSMRCWTRVTAATADAKRCDPVYQPEWLGAIAADLARSPLLACTNAEVMDLAERGSSKDPCCMDRCHPEHNGLWVPGMPVSSVPQRHAQGRSYQLGLLPDNRC